MMHRVVATILILLLAGPAGGAVPAPAAPSLAGLWQAALRFGPDLRGTLILYQDRGWLADVAGRTIPVTASADRLTFALPDAQGTFRGRLDASGDVIGHWYQARTVTSGTRYATPLRLRRDGARRWRGTIAPLDDRFTAYLMLTPRPDGSLGAFLRNPERNFGVFMRLDRLALSGTNVTLIGRSRDGTSDVTVASGSYDADDDVLSIAIPGRGGTYAFTRASDDSAFYARGEHPAPYVYRAPLQRDDGWLTAPAERAGMRSAGLARYVQAILDTPIDSVHAPDIHGVLIARHGKLVLEEYFHGFDRDTLHDTRSAAKSLTSTLAGAVMQAGAKLRTSTPVYAAMNGGTLPAGLEPRKQSLTVEHLLTMSSGFYCDDSDDKAPGNENTMQEQTAQPDWYRYALDLPMASAPGATTVYCSTNPNLLGGVIARSAGEPLEDLFDRLVGGPLQFGRYALFLQPTGEPYMGGGMHVLPRDFMKLGQLMLDGGTWHGRRVVSAAWAKRAASPLRRLGTSDYGYLWWVGDVPYRGRTLHTFYASGNGGQIIQVIPALDLVIATYAGNYSDKILALIEQTYLPQYILPALD